MSEGVLQLSAKIDFADTGGNRLAQEFSRNAGTAVKYEGSVGYFVADFFEALKIDPHGAFIETMCSADGNCERIYAGFFHKPRGVFWSGECFTRVFGVAVLAYVAQLSFNRNAGCMCEVYHPARKRTIFRER